MKYRFLFGPILILSGVFLFAACSDTGSEAEEGKASLTEGGMKCGAGKCGTSMVDGNTILAKKKKNILSQMREDDPRKGCVLRAGSSKTLYDCIRDPKTGYLTTKCGIGKCNKAPEDITMKCGAGKCGSGMSKPKIPPKPKAITKKNVMKCGEGKCGSSMSKPAKKAKPNAEMKCAAGKCGGK